MRRLSLVVLGRFGTGRPINSALREYRSCFCFYHESHIYRAFMLAMLHRTWEVGSSLVALGITARVGIPLTFFVSTFPDVIQRSRLSFLPQGFLIISFVITLHGRMGSLYHVPFPVLNRAAWGVNGVYCAYLTLLWLTTVYPQTFEPSSRCCLSVIPRSHVVRPGNSLPFLSPR